MIRVPKLSGGEEQCAMTKTGVLAMFYHLLPPRLDLVVSTLASYTRLLAAGATATRPES